jgi:acyl dehydratase
VSVEKRPYIENRTFDETSIGDEASLSRTLAWRDIELFAAMSGDVNPAHVDAEFAKSDMFHRIIAHGMWGGALISTVLGTELPGPGTIYVSESLQFRHPIGLGELLFAQGSHRYDGALLRKNGDGLLDIGKIKRPAA